MDSVLGSPCTARRGTAEEPIRSKPQTKCPPVPSYSSDVCTRIAFFYYQ